MGKRVVGVVAALAATLGLVALATTLPQEEVAAKPGAVGYHTLLSNWDFGPNPDWNDGSHTAYNQDIRPQTAFYGSYRTPLRSTSFTVDRDVEPQPWVNVRVVSKTVSLSGITGGVAEIPQFSPNSVEIRCQSPTLPGGGCAVPSQTYSITLTWSVTARSGPCVYRTQFDSPPSSEECPEVPLSGTATRTVVAGVPGSTTTTTELSQEPVAEFGFTASEDDPYEVTFEDRSTDDGGTDQLTHEWDFGDDTPVSVDRDPVHRFARAGTFPVTLTVTDASDQSDSTTVDVTVSTGIVVNSTGDGAAEDVSEHGCDTGDTVEDGSPECTLRAAIETANDRGGADIAFAIPDGGIPAIEAATALPVVASSTNIDGTTQDGGWVRVHGTGEGVLQLTGGTSSVTGLAIGGDEAAVLVTGGSGHRIEGNRLGTDATGTEADGTAVGIGVGASPGLSAVDNVTGAVVGLIAGPGSDGLEAEGNAFGVSAEGQPIGEPRGGIIVGGAGAVVRDNVARGGSVGIAALSSTASGATIEGNHVGVDRAGTTQLPGMGYGIRVDGAPDATVADNHVVADAYGAITVSGSRQYSNTGDEIEFLAPDDDVQAGAVTGGRATITGNTVGLVGTADATDDAGRGIVSWAGAGGLVVEDNTVGGTAFEAVSLTGGTGHRVAGNTLGTAAVPVGGGVVLDGTTRSAVGGVGAGNAIVAVDAGVEVTGVSPGTRVEGNTVTITGDGDEPVGIRLGAEAADPVVTGNAVTGAQDGIGAGGARAKVIGNTVTDASGFGIGASGLAASVTGNAVVDAATGISAGGDRPVVADNSVVGGEDGIRVEGATAEVSRNRVGLPAGSETVDGGTGTGISVDGGDATLARNVVVGSDGGGIDVDASATAELRSNRIWDVTGSPITAPGAPDAPVLAAAIESGGGESLRRTLLIAGLPEDDAGTIEVFAADSCTDPEPRFVLEINRKKGAAEQQRIIQVKGNSTRDHFTLTYTDGTGRTSELSNCQDATVFEDGDGDGSVDPLDAVVDRDDDPTSAVIATDSEQLLLLSVAPYDVEVDDGGGVLEDVGIVEDPAPGSHPAGWSLPYGALRFRITGLFPGNHTTVLMATLSGDSPIGGTSYWKYGPATEGAPPSWFSFGYDAASDTGARLTEGVPIAGTIQRAWVLRFGDGDRGDADGDRNGTITDPGGPVLGAPTPADPPDPMPTLPTDPTTPTAAAPGAGPGGGTGSGGTGAGPTTGTLPRTGADTGPVTQGLLLVVAGAVLVVGARTRRRTTAG